MGPTRFSTMKMNKKDIYGILPPPQQTFSQ
jgi:hypothetical protein